MDQRFIRSQALIGKEAMCKLSIPTVSIFGIGGVGSYAAEILARTGITNFKLIDYDIIDLTNINRQIHALDTTVGKSKVEVMKSRILDINPKAKIQTYNLKYQEGLEEKIGLLDSDYIIDAIDTISSKISLIEYACKNHIPIISAMGAGNKIDPSKVKINDIYDTKVCPLARVMRRELRKREISNLCVVWSDEDPINVNLGDKDRRKAVPASIAFVPSIFGILMASKVIKDLSL